MRQLSFTRLLLFTVGVAVLVHYTILLWKELSPSTLSITQKSSTASRYFCPMHPSVISDHPDNCPVCGMALQREDITAHETKPSREKKVLYYRHPMGKNVTSPIPVKDEMGMDFIPVYEDESSTNGGITIDGRTAFLISEASQQLIGVKRARVNREAISHEIKASGRVAFDPDLYSAVAEYQIAKETADLTKQTSDSIKRNSEALVLSSKLKLKLMGLSDEQIAALESNRFDAKALLLPKGKVWVYADVYEYELPHLKMGQSIITDSPLYPTETFEGKIVSISPIINATTRTVNIKAEVLDSKQRLKPDMFLTVRIQVDLGAQLIIPDDAIIHTGDVNLVFRIDNLGRFEPQKVELGITSKGKSIVLSGLAEGETVVSGANFLIDSESRLRSVVQNALSSRSNHKDH